MTAAAILLVGGVIAGAVNGGRLNDRLGHRPVVATIEPVAPSMASPSRFMRGSALGVASVPAEATPERYSHFDHSDTPAPQMAFVSFPHHSVAETPDSKGDRLLSGQAKPLVASLGHPQTESLPAQVLAYASPSPRADGGALAAIDSATHIAPDLDDMGGEEALLLPDAVPLPAARPEISPADTDDEDAAPARRTGKPDSTDRADQPSEARKTNTPDAARPGAKAVAMARPNLKSGEESDQSPGIFKKLFSGRPRAGNGVAVYDISAGKVYMPDGSVLKAASGIGKMANNPKYTHVRMNGPTPPHTYNLRMREKRFHGVEAIRMLPVDGKNKHGRDGFLAHSELLRGRPGQSHGCVAFKDYDKFLRAFKQGKVKQMIVVPGGGAGVFARTAAKGNDV